MSQSETQTDGAREVSEMVVNLRRGIVISGDALQEAADLLARTEARRVESTEAVKKLTAIVSDLGQKNAELEEVVEKLPRTANGVPVVPGVCLWGPIDRDQNSYKESGWLMDERGNIWLRGILSLVPRQSAQTHNMRFKYSTREAALAAREQNGGSDE